MSKLMKVLGTMLVLALIAVLAVACGPPETITETITEAEFNEEEGLFGLVADLQPGKIVLTGEVEGSDVVADLTTVVTDAGLYFQIERITVDGTEALTEDFTDLNIELRGDLYTPEEGYVVTDVTITDNELTITSSLR